LPAPAPGGAFSVIVQEDIGAVNARRGLLREEFGEFYE